MFSIFSPMEIKMKGTVKGVSDLELNAVFVDSKKKKKEHYYNNLIALLWLDLVK